MMEGRMPAAAKIDFSRNDVVDLPFVPVMPMISMRLSGRPYAARAA